MVQLKSFGDHYRDEVKPTGTWRAIDRTTGSVLFEAPTEDDILAFASDAAKKGASYAGSISIVAPGSVTGALIG